MSSNLYNKAGKNVKFKSNNEKIQYTENEMNDNLKNSFNLELNTIIKSIEQRKLQRVALFEFLSKYDGNIPETFFYKNVMKLGEILMKNKYWTSANNECYERYLVSVMGTCVEELCIDVENCVKACLCGNDDRVELTASALFGVCRAQLGDIETIDPLFESGNHRTRCQNLLRIYQSTMEAIICKEKCCWIIYNGTVHIYEICHKLIRSQCAIIAVEPLIWASCCMETSIPLLTIANLQWRATLYTAVCQAFYNCGKDAEAERFARRGLVKINELNALYEMSSESLTVDNSLIITEATIKMAVMIFKRAVFEIRRRPKTYLRPKTKINFKELLQGNWPRTGTERLLVEMFESPSQQALAIVEAVKQPSRSLGKIGLPTSENDWDILDVYSELFYAFTAIVTGRSSLSSKSSKGFIQEFKVVSDDQLNLSRKSGSDVSITTVFEMACWAFTYGNWEFIDVVADPLMNVLKESKSTKEIQALISTLQLMSSMQRAVLSSKLDKKTVKLVDQNNDDDKTKEVDGADIARSNLGSASTLSKDTKSSKSKRDYAVEELDEKQNPKGAQDPLNQLAELVQTLISDDNIEVSLFSREILIEAGVILWSKCKSVLHSVQDGSLQNKVLQRISSPGKWINILSVVHRLFIFTNYAQINPVSFAEITLRLAVLLEDISLEDAVQYEKDFTENLSDGPSLSDFLAALQPSVHSKLEKCLLAAKEALQLSLKQLDKCRARYSMNEYGSETNTADGLSRNNSLDDIYLELNSLYFRIAMKSMVTKYCARKDDKLTLADLKKIDTYKECFDFCNKNSILKALFYGNVAREMNEILDSKDIEELSNMSRSMLEKAHENLSVRRCFKHNADGFVKLPPPLVVERGSDFISLAIDTDNIVEELRDKIGWIRLYGRPVDSPNAEVRLTDDKLPGTGLETSSLKTVFTVRNLLVNEQYIFAFAVFDKSGSMIGRGMGHSTKKILACDGISSITASTLIAQMLYEIGLKNEVIRYESELWNHFMEPLMDSTDQYQQLLKPRSYLHHTYKMKSNILDTSSAMLLRQFCLLVMSSVDCYALLNSIDTEPLSTSKSHVKEEILRISLCDKLLAMFTISTKLKNHVLSMELFVSVVQLTIPIMNHNLYYEPFVQILVSALTTLKGLPQTTWIKIPVPFKINIHHLIASAGFYLLKYYNRFEPTNSNLELMRNITSVLLQMSSDLPFTVSEQDDEVVNHSNVTSRLEHATTQRQALPGKKTYGKSNRTDGSTISNLSPQQIAFEAYKYSMVVFDSPMSSNIGRNVYRNRGPTEPSVTGTDEPDILVTFIANLPSKLAYKEVVKFVKKTRYFQFVVEVISKSTVEGNYDQSIGWYKEVREWLRKRNEGIIGRLVLPSPSQMNVDMKMNEVKDVNNDKDPSPRTVIEDDDMDTAKKHGKKLKKPKYKAITVTSVMNEVQRQKQEELELKAVGILATTFLQFYKRSHRRRKFRQVSKYELPSRAKLNSSIAMSYLGIAQSKIDSIIQMLSAGYNLSDIPQVDDVTAYMLNTTGKILPLTCFRDKDKRTEILKITKSKKNPETDRPRTFRPDMKSQDKRIITEAPKLLSHFLDNLTKATVLLKKAIVLSERGNHWLLLTRACSVTWHSLSIVINMSVKLQSFINNAKIEYPDIDWNPIQVPQLLDIFKMFLEPFYFGAESLLDFLEIVNSEQNIDNFDKIFMEHFILRALHLLFESKNYEKFIHVTLRFTRVTKYFYVNVTHPLLVQCQESLVQMAKERQQQDPNWSEEMSKQHIIKSIKDLDWNQIDSSNYDDFLLKRKTGKIGRVNLSVVKKNLVQQTQSLRNEASHVKNLMTFLTSKNNSWILFSVPVDVDVSIQEWKQNSEEGNLRRSWMEICHKRQLYLYQRSVTAGNGDESLISFNYVSHCYKNLIDTCKAKDEQEYCGLLQRDLGDLCVIDGHNRGRALSFWKESLENLLSQKCAFEYLEKLLTNSSGNIIDSVSDTEKLSTKFGILTCLEIGGVLCRIIKHGDYPINKRTILCCYAALFYKAAYGTSLSNSDCDLSYLDENMSLDQINPVPLLVKVHLATDQSRIDIQDMETRLSFLIDELIQAGFYQFTLPLMSLYEHIVSTYCRNYQKCIYIRILKLDAAIQLQLFSIASRLLFQLLTGDKLPQQLDSQMTPSVAKTISEMYDDRKDILDENNLTVLDRIMSRRLNANVAQKIGLNLTNRLSILQAKFLLAVSTNIIGPIKVLESKSPSPADLRTVSKKSTVKKAEPVSGQSDEVESILEQVSSRMQLESPKQITLPQLKGLLLQTAGTMIQPITSDLLISIQKESPNPWKLARGDVKNIILSLLLQAEISRAQHFNRSGARLAMFACRVLDENGADCDPASGEHYRDERSLNVRLHVRCSQEIVTCLLDEVSIGQILDFSKTAVTDVPDLKALILASISECDENGLFQFKAWFVAALGQYALCSGYDAGKYLAILKESMAILEEEMILSEESKNVYRMCSFQAINCNLSLDKTISMEYLENSIIGLQNGVLKDLDKKYRSSVFWNSKDPGLSLPRICNKYDVLYDEISRLKLLLANVLVKKSMQSPDGSSERFKILNILNAGLDIVRTISARKPWMEVEMLMMIGRIQRYLLLTQKIAPSTAVSTLVEGLKLSILSSGHLGIQKQFYMELALTFLQCSRLNPSSFNDQGMISSNADFSIKIIQTQTKSKPAETIVDAVQYSRLAWLALQSAGYVTRCMRQRSHIKSDASRILSSDSVQKLPLVIGFDLYGHSLLGDKRIIFKNEIEEELSRMPEARVARDSENLEDQLDRIRKSAPVLSWSHLLTYQEMLTRITNNHFLTTSTTENNGFILNSLTRRIFSSSQIFSKEFYVHQFLKSEMDDYAAKCVPFIPKDILQFANVNTKEGVEDGGAAIVTEWSSTPLSMLSVDSLTTNVIRITFPYYPGIFEEVDMKDKDDLERMDLYESNVSIQMFNPPFEQYLHSEEKVLLLYSCSKKIPKNANKSEAFITGWRMVQSDQLLQVYEDLQETAHHLEILSNNSDVPPPTKPMESSKKPNMPVNTKATKSTNQYTTLGSGLEISDTELKFRNTFDTIVSWINATPSQTFAPPKNLLTKVSFNTHSVGENSLTLNNIPFDLNADNARSLANLLNPIHSKNIVNNLPVTKFLLDSLKIDFL